MFILASYETLVVFCSTIKAPKAAFEALYMDGGGSKEEAEAPLATPVCCSAFPLPDPVIPNVALTPTYKLNFSVGAYPILVRIP